MQESKPSLSTENLMRCGVTKSVQKCCVKVYGGRLKSWLLDEPPDQVSFHSRKSDPPHKCKERLRCRSQRNKSNWGFYLITSIYKTESRSVVQFNTFRHHYEYVLCFVYSLYHLPKAAPLEHLRANTTQPTTDIWIYIQRNGKCNKIIRVNENKISIFGFGKRVERNPFAGYQLVSFN